VTHDPSHGHDDEPIRGLPGYLPPGEQIVWQGAPAWGRLAVEAFFLRWVGLWFGALALWAMLSGAGIGGLTATVLAGGAAVGILCLLAWLSARASVYTITNRRLVLRIGAALPTCINIPFAIVETAGLKRYADGSGDMPLKLKGEERMGYALLWPHARPWRFSDPEPMLRAVPDAARVADILARAMAEAVPSGRRLAIASEAQAVAPAGEVAAA
jgi:hypothetical protein